MMVEGLLLAAIIAAVVGCVFGLVAIDRQGPVWVFGFVTLLVVSVVCGAGYMVLAPSA